MQNHVEGLMDSEFSEEDYLKTCRELDVPDTAGWELFVESRGVSIYRLYNEVTGLYSYKIYGGMNMPPDKCARVYTDLEYRKTWDGYVKELYEINDGDKTGIYWQVKFPFPLSNRDYTYVRGVRELMYGGRAMWVVLARAAHFIGRDEVEGVVRVKEYDQGLAMVSDGQGGTKAFMRYYDNPGGSIPTWLVNWAAKNGVPSFLDDMNKACDNYDRYLETRKGKEGR